MKIRKEILDRFEIFKENRREIHKYPEIGFDTKETMNRIKRLLNLNTANDDEYSGVFYLPSEKECIAFRCELDGLPIKEENDVDYQSTNAYMHACGHDAHMAILIETIHYFLHHPHKKSLLFIFQPAEESGAGSKYMMCQNIFEKYKVKECYATHVMPNLGDYIGCKENIMMAKSREIHLHIQGKGAHAGHKELGIDAMKATTFFLEHIYQIESDLKPNILHFGKLESGYVGNAVSSNSYLVGTMRCFNEKSDELIQNFLINLIKNIDEQFQTESSIEFKNGYDAVVNDKTLVDKIKKLLSDDYLEIQPLALSEDFSFYSQKCKCCYTLCGLSSKTDLHDSRFDLDEKECLKAIELNIRIVENE